MCRGSAALFALMLSSAQYQIVPGTSVATAMSVLAFSFGTHSPDTGSG